MRAPGLHGRDNSLHSLRTALTSARAGRGQLILISGEPGIGKSALAAALAAEAEAARITVTWGRAWEFADAPPYFPLWPCLRSIGVELAPQRAGEHDEGHAFHLWESVLGALARASTTTPLVWIVEDIHAADLGTLDLLTFLVQPLRAMPVLIVATARMQDARLTERKLQRLGRMVRDGSELRLEPLSEADIAAVTEETLGRAVPDDARRRLVELTGGNPLFVVECARAFRTAGGIEGTLGSLPPTVRQVVADRVALLPESTRQMLASGAVLGREFSAALVARMHDTLPARVIDALLPALRAGILRELKPGQFGFSHTLVRDAIDESLAELERARLHGLADHALDALGDTAEILVERARHALAAVQSGEPAHALARVRRATELLEREGAFDRAFALHARVSDACAAGFLPARSPEDKLAVARVAREAGRADVARQLCEEAIATARSDGNAELFARATLLHASAIRVGVIDPQQIGLLEEAHRMLAGSAPHTSCRVLARWSTALQPSDDNAVPLAMARQARAMAHATGDDAAIIDVLEMGGFGACGAPIAERMAWAEELRDRALGRGELAKALTGWVSLAYWQLEGGDFAGAERAAASALSLSDEIGHPRHRWAPLLLASGLALAQGRLAESDRHLTEVAQIAALIDDLPLALAVVMHEMGRAKLLHRADELASPRLEGVLGGIKHNVLYGAITRAGFAARLEDVAATRAQLAIVGGQANLLDGDPEAMILLGEAYALAGSDEQRRRHRGLVARMTPADVFGIGVSFSYEGSTVRILGLLDAALGELASAENHLASALARARERRHAPWIVQLAHELGKVLRRLGREAEARALTDEQVAVARDLGITALAGAPSPEQAPQKFSLLRSGDVWTVSSGSTVARVKDSRGMQLLARLVDRPGEEIHVLALASDEGASAPESSAGDLIDDSARKAYRARVLELDEALAAAERAGNAAAARRLEREKGAIVAELARASGLGGRSRQAGSTTERARVNVQRRLKDAVAKVAEVAPDVGRLLDRAVSTGTFCCFRP